MSNLRVGDRAGVIKGALEGYYGHCTDHILSPETRTLIGYGIRLQGNGHGKPNPRFLEVDEWFLPTDYLKHID